MLPGRRAASLNPPPSIPLPSLAPPLPSPSVILACRSASRGAALAADLLAKDAPAGARARGRGAKAGTVEVRPLDLASLDSVRAFGASFLLGSSGRPPSTPPPLHVLINNAGIFTMVGGRAETVDGLESHMGTNHLGPFLLTLLLLPALARGGTAAHPARVVHVSSVMHRTASGIELATDPQQRLSYSPKVAYSQSKLAQVIFAAELRRRLGGRGGSRLKQHQEENSTTLASPPGSPSAPAASTSTAATTTGRRRRRGGAGRRRGGGGGSGGSGSTAAPPISVTAVHPGEVMTDVVRSLPAAVQAVYRKLMSAVLLTPPEGARSSVWAASALISSPSAGRGCPTSLGLVGLPAADPALCYFGSGCVPEAPLIDALDPALGRWLWSWSAERVGLVGEGGGGDLAAV